MKLVAFFGVLLLVGASSILAAPVITITSPLDEANANPTGGANDPVDVTYQVTGNTCTGVKSTYAIVPYVNNVAVSCAGSGCSCDGTSESCNNVTKTITLDGNAFSSCVNTIRLEMSLNTIFHEALHNCGVPDEREPDGRLADDIARECVGD